MATRIFGMPFMTFSGRVAYATISGGILLALYTLVPETIYKGVGQGPSLLGGDSFLDYALMIAVLSGIQIVFSGRWLGDAAAIGNGISQMVYLYLLTNGGILSLSFGGQGLSVTVDFRTILYLMMLPSALLLVSTVVGAAGRVSIQKFQDNEEVIMT